MCGSGSYQGLALLYKWSSSIKERVQEKEGREKRKMEEQAV